MYLEIAANYREIWKDYSDQDMKLYGWLPNRLMWFALFIAAAEGEI